MDSNAQVVQETLRLIVKPEYYEQTSTWIEAATPEELEGFKLIRQIYDTKGQCVSALHLLTGRNEGSKLFLSTYQRFFGGTYLPGMSEIAVLQYKKVSELQCAVAMNKVILLYIDNWIAKEPNERRKILVMKALRSIAAKVRTREIPKSHNTRAFRPYEISKLLKSEKINFSKRFTQTLPALAPPSPVEKKQNIKGKPHKTVFESLISTEAIKAQQLKGNGDITGSCFQKVKESTYMDTYRNPVGTCRIKMPEMNFRMSFGGASVIPDPYLTLK